MKIITLKYFFVILLLNCSLPNLYSQDPWFSYPTTDYDENYRGQFHYSAQAGWINDVNGLWYYDGVYHLSYQHYPHGLQWGPMHWGRATSTDLIHWTQEPIMLEPNNDTDKDNIANVPGMAFSGSVVVDVNNTSNLRTGANPVFVAIYTAAETTGTCLAYSNDLGATWQNYAGNPVNVGSPSKDASRDPHVLWHAPTNKWICLIYENGTTFYTSSDLKTWTKTSNVPFGFECPDFYELAVDGGATKKWILQDASGKYLIGDFNGTAFTQTVTGEFLMDQGPDFYAAQTFYRPTLPDNRLIQMAWLSHWGGGITTSPWARDITFPVELKLKTTADGIRLTRTPISEITSNYSSSVSFGAQVVPASTNLLADINSKCFDMTYEFDVANSTATEVVLQIANKSIVYNIASKTLLGKTLNPIANKVKIRVLADWSQLEVFGNDGIFSWTEQVAFTPTDESVSLTANGNLSLTSLVFNKVKRTWPIIACTGVDLPSANTLSIGNSITLKPTFTPLNTSDKSGVWASSKPLIATVDSKGIVTAKGVGSTVISFASTGGCNDNCTITVIPTPNYLTYDFEAGDLSGFTTTGTAFTIGDVVTDNLYWTDQLFRQHGNYHLWGYKVGADIEVGTLRTDNFKIEGDGKIKFLIGGGRDESKLFVGLYRTSDNALLMKTTANNEEKYSEVMFDAFQYVGTCCYLKVVDNATGEWGHLNWDYIRIPGTITNNCVAPVCNEGTIYLVGDAATVSGLASSEKLAYNWAIANFTNPKKPAKYISFASISATGVPSDCGLLWFYYTGGLNLPVSANTAASNVIAYCNGGGNVLLTGLASKYAVQIGATNVATNEESFISSIPDDAWGICPVAGQEANSIYSGLVASTWSNPAWGGYRTITTATAGVTEAYAWWKAGSFTGSRLGICPWFKPFNDLSTQWTPVGEFENGESKVLVVSLPGYTWTSANGATEQATLERFTKNCIEYVWEGKCPTSLNLIQSNVRSIEVYPVPTSNVLNIKTDLDIQNRLYDIISLSGVTCLSGVLDKREIDVASLNSGVYVLRIIGSENIYQAKFVKK